MTMSVRGARGGSAWRVPSRARAPAGTGVFDSTLRARIDKAGALPPLEALGIARQILSGQSGQPDES